MLYLSLLPQFIDPQAGNVLVQSLALGFTQIAISVTINALIAVTAGSIAIFLASRPVWLLVQRWLMGTVLSQCEWRSKLGAEGVGYFAPLTFVSAFVRSLSCCRGVPPASRPSPVWPAGLRSPRSRTRRQVARAARWRPSCLPGAPTC